MEEKKSQKIGEEPTEHKLIVSNTHLDTLLQQHGTSNQKLLLDPEGYAKKAIEIIEEQLSNARTENKRNKLRYKLDSWRKFLEVLGEENGSQEERS